MTRYLRHALWAAATFAAACGGGSEPEDEDLLAGTWSAEYDPAIVVSWPSSCERTIPHANLSMGDSIFGLSVNTYDDCRTSGGEFTASEVLHLGTRSVQGSELSFTPHEASAPLFTGTVEGDFIRLTLPPAVGVASEVVELMVGPRQPPTSFP